MKNHIKKSAFQIRIVRILTLISFFHFSGLNNGFTQVFVSAGNVEGMNFAPVAIRKAAQGLNPVFWKKIISQNSLKETLFVPGRVLSTASQTAVQRMLVEGNLFQVWMNATLKRAVQGSGRSVRPEGKDGGQNPSVHGGAARLENKNILIETPLDYLNLEREWLKLGNRMESNLDPHWIRVKNNSAGSSVNTDFSKRMFLPGSDRALAGQKFKGVGYHQRGGRSGEDALLADIKIGRLIKNHSENLRGDFLFRGKP